MFSCLIALSLLTLLLIGISVDQRLPTCLGLPAVHRQRGTDALFAELWQPAIRVTAPLRIAVYRAGAPLGNQEESAAAPRRLRTQFDYQPRRSVLLRMQRASLTATYWWN